MNGLKILNYLMGKILIQNMRKLKRKSKILFVTCLHSRKKNNASMMLNLSGEGELEDEKNDKNDNNENILKELNDKKV